MMPGMRRRPTFRSGGRAASSATPAHVATRARSAQRRYVAEIIDLSVRKRPAAPDFPPTIVMAWIRTPKLHFGTRNRRRDRQSDIRRLARPPVIDRRRVIIATRNRPWHLGFPLNAQDCLSGFAPSLGRASASSNGREDLAITDWRGGVFNGNGFDVPSLIEYTQHHKPSTICVADRIAPRFLCGSTSVLIPARSKTRSRWTRHTFAPSSRPAPRADDARPTVSARARLLVVPDSCQQCGVPASYFEWCRIATATFWTEGSQRR